MGLMYIFIRQSGRKQSNSKTQDSKQRTTQYKQMRLKYEERK